MKIQRQMMRKEWLNYRKVKKNKIVYRKYLALIKLAIVNKGVEKNVK